ncbi:hypothetical protein [Qipengyuania zhejiangensis]|uniref:hypothetical protein n=1 Tax=Qipengyuania zhejiangensis TaxID=3077782 RepID=UPI002D79A213|nr:hypothetical protein [Qipengyuania sp. Z2]
MITDPVPIEAPGGFAPVVAFGSDDGSGHLTLASPDAPIPTVALAPAAPSPVQGSATSPGIAGPFAPAPFSPVYLTLSGDWEGRVQVLRSCDGGMTKHPLTLGGSGWGGFSANACEPVWSESERGAELYLQLAPVSGTIAYRVAQ